MRPREELGWKEHGGGLVQPPRCGNGHASDERLALCALRVVADAGRHGRLPSELRRGARVRSLSLLGIRRRVGNLGVEVDDSDAGD